MLIWELLAGLFKKETMLGSIGDTFIKAIINLLFRVSSQMESSSQISKTFY